MRLVQKRAIRDQALGNRPRVAVLDSLNLE